MGERVDLQTIFEDLLGSDSVHFQQPSNVSLVYPTIIYKLDDISTDYADNSSYRRTKRYQVTLIDYDPDSPIVDRLLDLPTAAFDRAFAADQLNHFVIDLYF